MSEPIPRKGLHRLVYASNFSAAFPSSVSDQDHEIGEIIRASIRNNRAVAITGLLLARDRWFMQVLEGPTDAVAATYERIVRDPRHRRAAVIESGPAPARLFANWNMCARRLSRADDAILARLALDETRLGSLSPAQAVALLVEVRDLQAQTAAEQLG